MMADLGFVSAGRNTMRTDENSGSLNIDNGKGSSLTEGFVFGLV